LQRQQLKQQIRIERVRKYERDYLTVKKETVETKVIVCEDEQNFNGSQRLCSVFQTQNKKNKYSKLVDQLDQRKVVY
jgi:hypothetical protein